MKPTIKILTTTCTGVPMCYHMGILICENGHQVVYNKTPSLANAYGGNIISQPISEFMKGRKLISVRALDMSAEVIKRYACGQKLKKWNAFHFNCEDFVTEAVYADRKSSLRSSNLTICAFALIAML